MTNKIFIIDGYSFLFRAYYSMPPLVSPDNLPVGAIYGFTSMLMKLISDFRPKYAAVVFDSGSKNFRHDLYPEYKGNRLAPPEDLIPQFEVSREAARTLGFKIFSEIGYEADDVIASLSKRFLSEEIVIVSSDKDLMQLVSPNISLYDSMKEKMINKAEVIAKFGVGPELVVDILSIMGDASDNIPGIPGIGPKGALELLNKFGSLEKILENAEHIPQKAKKAAIINNMEKALLSKQLVSLRYDIDVNVSLEDLSLNIPEQKNINSFCEIYGFISLKAKAAKLFNHTTSDNAISLAENPFIKFVDLDTEFEDNNSIKKLTFDLKTLMQKYPGRDFSSFEDLSLMHYVVNAGSKDKIDIKCDPYVLYGDLLPLLHKHKALDLYYNYDLPFTSVLFEIEKNGIKVDAGILQDLSKEFHEKLVKVTKKIFDIAGQEFNLGSPKQLAEILFQKLKLPKSKTSSSTNVDVLEDLSHQGFKIADHILEWRQLTKLKNTYTDVLPNQIRKETGRIHTTFSQTITSTSRLSSTNPNLQNIPIRSSYGERIRSSFIPENGWKFISADYSQIELRLLAHVASMDSLIDVFNNNGDIHSRTSIGIFGDVNKDLRRLAKAINFGIIYGISPFGLAKQLNITQKEAKDYIEKYFQLYPGIREYMDDTIKLAQENGYVENIFGRKSFTPEINSKNWALRAFAERAAINAPLQSSSADITKIAMNRLHKYLKENNYQTKMILQIHDEILFESPEYEAEKVSKEIQNIMQEVVNLKSKLVVDIKIQNSWFEL